MTDKLCPECGHDVEMHGTQTGCRIADCECVYTRWESQFIAERDEARALARKFYRERNEARRDMANLWHGTYLGADPERDLIDDGFGNITLRWCAHCGGDMQVVRPGQFQCGECGR